MRQSTITVTLAPGSTANYLCTSQTVAGAANLTINGTGATTKANTIAGTSVVVGIPDTNGNCRQITITSGGSDESGKTFTVYGRLSTYGPIVSEVITGPTAAATVTSTNLFCEVTRIAVSAALTGNVTAGVNAVGASQPFPVDRNIAPFNIGLALGVSSSGSPNFTVEETGYDVQDQYSTTVPVWYADATIAAKTAATQASLTLPCTAIRLKNNSGTGTGTLTVTQAGV